MWLEPAQRLLDDGRPAAALEALLDAWRARRLPALADVIDTLSQHLTHALPPVKGPTRKATQEAWLDLANARRDVDVGRLLDAFPSPPWVHVGERIERLAHLDDPRVARAFGAFAGELPTMGGIGSARWTLLFQALERMKDARVRPRLEQRLATADLRVLVQEHINPAAQRVLDALPPDDATADELAWVQALARRVAEVVRAPPPPPEVLLADTTRARRTTSEAELLAAIFDTPEDDGARLVFADWLYEQGDARAELLALQLKSSPTAKDERRARQLVKLHGRAWLGALEPAVVLRSEVFERGFLAEARLEFRTAKQREELVGHPAWNTLTRLHSADEDFLVRTELRGLEELRWASEELVEKLATRAWPWRRLRHLTLATPGLSGLRRLDRQQFPRLSSLELNTWRTSDVDIERTLPDLSHPSLAGLEALRLNGIHSARLVTLLGALPKLTRLSLSLAQVVTLTRAPQGPWTLDVEPAPYVLRGGSIEDTVRPFLGTVTRVYEPHVGWAERRQQVRDALESLRRRHDFEWVPRAAKPSRAADR